MDIRNLNIIVGSLPAKVRGLVEEWAEMHQEELLTNVEHKNVPQNQAPCVETDGMESVYLIEAQYTGRLQDFPAL